MLFSLFDRILRGCYQPHATSNLNISLPLLRALLSNWSNRNLRMFTVCFHLASQHADNHSCHITVITVTYKHSDKNIHGNPCRRHVVRCDKNQRKCEKMLLVLLSITKVGLHSDNFFRHTNLKNDVLPSSNL